MTVAALKVNLIQQIIHIEDSVLLMQLDKIIHELHQEDTPYSDYQQSQLDLF
jgi:hypothetical protein